MNNRKHMSKKKVKAEEAIVGICGDCAKFVPYTKEHLDPIGVPILGTCPHKLWMILRGERGCECFKPILSCKK